MDPHLWQQLIIHTDQNLKGNVKNTQYTRNIVTSLLRTAEIKSVSGLFLFPTAVIAPGQYHLGVDIVTYKTPHLAFDQNFTVKESSDSP